MKLRVFSVFLLASLASCTTEAPREHAATLSFDNPTLPPVNSGSGGSSSLPTETGGSSFGGENSGTGGTGEPPIQEFGCGAPPSVGGTFTKKQLRVAAGQCAVWQYCRGNRAAEVLESSLSKANSIVEATASRTDYIDLAKVWGEIEVFQFGPLPLKATSVTATYDPYHGKDYRPRIYSWPQVSRCKTEEQLATEKYKTNLDGIVLNGRGLHALDYLLFYAGSDSSCASATPTAQTFANLGSAGISQRKIAYAKALSSDVKNRITTLLGDWDKKSGNFEATWENADGYPSEQEAMNVLAWSLLYVERQVKDWKLGVPAGMTAQSPITEFEAPYSGISRELMIANLKGFRRLYAGCSKDEDLGFDDWLVAAGHGELSEQLHTALDGAEAALDTLAKHPNPAASDYLAAYTAVKQVTNYLKGDLFGSQSPINLELPAGLEGDTD